MTDRLKILWAILRSSGKPFTAMDLAKQTGVNLATVRTVLHRDRRFIEESGRLETGSRGGRIVQYTFAEPLRSELEAEFDDLKAGFPPAIPAPVPEAPAVMVAAKDILNRRYRDTEEPEERAMLLETAEQYIGSARRILQHRPDSDALRYHEAELLRLEALAKTFELAAQPSESNSGLVAKIQGLLSALGNMVIPPALGVPVLAAAGWSPVVPAPQPVISSARTSEQYIDLFRAAWRHAAQAQVGSEPAASTHGEVDLSTQGMVEAASFFRRNVGQSTSDEIESTIARQITESVNPKLPISCMAVLGCDPACYRPGVLSIPEEPRRSGVTVWSMKYNAACQEFNYGGSPIQHRVMMAGF